LLPSSQSEAMQASFPPTITMIASGSIEASSSVNKKRFN
jgi:hypothetical protein